MHVSPFKFASQRKAPSNARRPPIMTVPVHAAPLISVVIPTHNMAEYVDEAIGSALHGELEDLEVIVVDDGSTDDTAERLAAYTRPGGKRFDPRVRSFRKENEGKSAAVNLAFTRMRGAYALILDADDQLAPGALSGLYAALPPKKNDRVLPIGGFETFARRQKLGERPAPPPTDPSKLRKRFYLSLTTPFHLNTCLISRTLIERTGRFDTRLQRCQDIDYAMRLLQETEEVAVVNEPVYRYRKHRQSVPERLRFRGQTLFYRALVFWKNVRGFAGLGIVCYGAAMDIAKAIYELFGNYKR